MSKTHGHEREGSNEGTTTVRCKIILVCRCGEHISITQTKWRHIQQKKVTRILDKKIKMEKKKKIEKEKLPVSVSMVRKTNYIDTIYPELLIQNGLL